MIKYYNSLSWRLGTQLKTREPGGLGKDPTVALLSTKSSWLFSFILIIATFFSSSSILAQTNIANYEFSRATGVTYTPISGGTVFASGAYDNQVSAAIAMGGTFNFGGVNYTSCFISANGFITFGAAPAGTNYTPLSTTAATVLGVVSAFGQDAGGSTASGATPEISYLNTGTEFVVQFSDHANYFNRATERLNFQIRLNFATGVINIIYGNCTNPGTTSTSGTTVQVGLRGNSTTYSNNVNSLLAGNIPAATTCDWSNAVTSFSNASTMLFSGTTNVNVNIPSGLQYTWSPSTQAPVRTFAATTGITSSSATLSWTAPTGATSYNVQYRTPGSCAWTNWSGNPVATNSVTLTGLAATTSYEVRVQASNGSAQSIFSHSPNTAGTGNGYTATGTFTTTATCPGTATAVTTSAITATSATISWTAASPAPSNGYLYEVRTSGAPGSGATGLVLYSSTAAGVTTDNLTGLTPNTAYSYYVRAFCGGTDVGVWTAASNFTTSCLPITTLPWNESFEDVTVGATVVGTSTNLPSCWNSQNVRWSSSNATTYNIPRTGNNYLRYSWSTTDAFIWTPGFELTGGVSYDFSFFGQGDGFTGWNNDIYVNTAVTPTGATQLTPTYTAAGSGTIALQSYAKVTRTFVPPANGVYYFAIRGNQSSGSPWYMAFDDFSLDLTPTCVQPGGLAVAFSSSSSANLSWNAPSPAPALGYEWAVTTSATPPTSGTATTDLTASVSSLLPATSYYLHVRSVCVDGVDYSAWSTSSGFIPPLVTSVPWVEGFATTTLPAQWSATSFFLSGTSNVGANPGNALVLNLWSSTTTGNFSTPNLGPVASNQLFTFDYRIINFSGTGIPGAGSGTYTLAVSTDFGATYTTLETFSNDGVAGWRNKSYSLAAYAGQYVKFRLTGNWVSGDYYIGLDNFAVTALCDGTPNGGTVNVTSQSVCPSFPVAPITVSGASNDAGITYQWEQSTDGGTSWGNAVGGTGATTVSYQPPVYAGTVILYRLKVTCTNSSEEAFSTTSEINGNPRAVPFTETFSDLSTLAGWSTSGFSVGSLRGATGNPGDNALTNLYSGLPTAQITTANFGPIVAGQAVMFDYQLSNYASPYGPPAAGSGSFEVLVSTNCGSTFTSLGVTTNNGLAGYQQKVHSLASYVGQNVLVRIVGTWVSGDYDLSIDNLSIMVPPPSITSFDPISVCEDNQELVTLTGEFFDGVSSVTIGSTTTTFNFVDSNTITFTVPIGATSGTISVTTPGGVATSTANLTVYPYPLNNPITGPDDKVCKDGTLQLNPGGAGSTWTSSNEAVATVDENGLVTGVSSGTAVISFSITDFGCTSTQDYDVTVFDNVVITTQPPSTKSIQTGTNSTISVVATGDGLTYQWYYYDANDDDYYPVVAGANFSGVDTDTLTIIDTPEEFDNYEFYCIVSGSAPCEDVTSNSTFISVGNTAITSNPSNQSVCDSGSATFTVATTGDVLTYTWYEDFGLGFEPVSTSTSGLTYSGDGTDTLTVNGITTANNNYSYQVIVESPAGQIVTSGVAVLTVGSSVSITTQPVDSNVCNSGGTTSYSVVATGSPSSISWEYSTSATGPFSAVANNAPVGATYNTSVAGTLGVTTTGSTPVSTYYYKAIVNAVAPCSNVESDIVSLTIDNPTISSQPVAGSVLRGASTSFTVATPTMGATIQWQRATAVGGPYTNVVDATPTGVTYTGADTATLTVITSAGAATGATNFYRAVVSAPPTCSVNSTGALLTIFDYCEIPTATSTSSYFDAFATTGGITNITNSSSGFSTGGYGNFTAQTVSQYQNSSVSFTTSLIGTTVGVAIWVDWNQDGTFQASERVYNTGAYVSSASGSFVVPATALLGATRMRIAMDWSATSPVACPATGGRREIEDYTFVVVQQPTCEGTPDLVTIASTQDFVCESGSISFSSTGYNPTLLQQSISWYESANGVDFTLIGGAISTTYTTPVISETRYYYMRVTCEASSEFTNSNVIQINVQSGEVLSSAGDEICGEGTAQLSATANEGFDVNWYTTASGGSSLGSGETFTTPVISETTTYYAAAEITSDVNLTLGAGATNSSAVGQSFLPGFWGGAKTQYIIRASELQAAGFVAGGTISSLGFRPTSSGQTYQGFYVYIGNTAATEAPATTFISNAGLTQVYAGTLADNGYLPVANQDNILTLGTGSGSSEFVWNGVSNLVVSFSWSTVPSASTSTETTMQVDNVGYPAAAYRQRDNLTPASMLAETSVSSRANFRPKFLINGVAILCASDRVPVVATVTEAPAFVLSSNAVSICAGATSEAVTVTEGTGNYSSFVWSPSTGVSGDELSGFTFNPTETTTYTLTASDVEGCQVISTVFVTVNQLPTVTVVPSSPSVCSVGNPTALVAIANPTYVTAGGCLTGSNGLFPAAAYTPANCNGTVYNIVTNAWAGEWSVINVVAGNVYTFGSSIASDRITISNFAGTTVFHTGIGNVVWVSSITGQIRFYISLNDGNCGSQNTSRVRTISCQANTDTYVWSPVEGLFTDAAGTLPYTGGATSTVYAKPAEDTIYTVTATSSTTCQNTTTVSVTVTPATTWYADTDGDGFGNDAVTLQACVQPEGYVAVGGDCNDAVASIYPGAPEICFDGILQNCNGELNDGCPVVLTQIRSYFCGTTLQHVNSSILADTPTGLPLGAAVTGYRYEITNLSTNAVREVEKAIAMVRVNETDIAGFNTAYSIRVMVRINQEWQDYGTACTILTPAIPTTTVSTVCGQVLASLQSAIYATTVVSSTGYEFEVSRMEGGVAVQTTTIERSVNNFKLTMLSGIEYIYASEYQVRVRVKANVNGVEDWSNYGGVCSVFTPEAPEAAIEGCGGEQGIAPATLTTPIYVTPLTGATQYRFTLSDGVGYNQVYTTSGRFFRLSNFNALSPLTPGGQYSVTVEAEIYGYFYAGKDCNITVPGGAIRSTPIVKGEETIKAMSTEFKAVAYPNPFANSFAVDVRTSNTERVSLTVYDMAGRLLEVKEVNANEVSNYQFGDRYPSGVYNMIVTQGEETRTVRVVKQ